MKRLLTLIPVLIATACEYVVDVEVPDGGNQLSIGSLAESDSTWRVDIAETMGIFGFSIPSQNEVLTNADVTVTDETTGRDMVLQHTRFGRYRSPDKPLAGHRYSIRVKLDGYPDVTAATTAPGVVDVTNAEMDTSKTIRYEMDDYFPVKLTINDRAGEENTYELQVFSRDSSWWDFDPNKEPYWRVSTSFTLFVINDLSLADKEDLLRNTPYPRRFSDESFDGEAKVVTLLVPRRFLYRSSYSFGIRIYNQGYEYAKFVDDRTLQYDLMGYPFTQPVPVYSNVDNRNGIFAVKTGTTVEWGLGPVWKPE
jgi:hypothetical protein